MNATDTETLNVVLPQFAFFLGVTVYLTVMSLPGYRAESNRILEAKVKFRNNLFLSDARDWKNTA